MKIASPILIGVFIGMTLFSYITVIQLRSQVRALEYRIHNLEHP